MTFHSPAKRQSQKLPLFQAAIASFVLLICLAPHLLAEKSGSSSPNTAVLNSRVLNSTAVDSAVEYQNALDSITAETLKQHVYFLADDRLQGRKPGTEGGREAGRHIAEEFKKYGLSPGDADVEVDFFQPFAGKYRNVLAILPGSDPQLKDEAIVIGAHYDHIGADAAGNVYNGADDNASGTAGLLELAEAFSMMPTSPKRTIIFAAWDGEESGLLGSRHWVKHPSPPNTEVVFMLNMDMIGRLRDDKLSIHASRSGYGLRQLISSLNSDLTIEFKQKIWMCSDHWSFYTEGVPSVMFNTGRHEELHSSNDDSELINEAGMRRIARLVFETANQLANANDATRFREASRNQPAEPDDGPRPLEPSVKLPDKPLKLGIFWHGDDAEPGTVVLTCVVPDTPAARAGLRPGDRIYRLGGKRFADDEEFSQCIARHKGPLCMLVEHDGKLHTVEVWAAPVVRAQNTGS